MIDRELLSVDLLPPKHRRQVQVRDRAGARVRDPIQLSHVDSRSSVSGAVRAATHRPAAAGIQSHWARHLLQAQEDLKASSQEWPSERRQ